jgi:hypothetical protein
METWTLEVTVEYCQYRVYRLHHDIIHLSKRGAEQNLMKVYLELNWDGVSLLLVITTLSSSNFHNIYFLSMFHDYHIPEGGKHGYPTSNDFRIFLSNNE